MYVDITTAKLVKTESVYSGVLTSTEIFPGTGEKSTTDFYLLIRTPVLNAIVTISF